MAATMGKQAQMAIDTALPFDGSSIPLEFVSEDLKKFGSIGDLSGIRGTRQHPVERTRDEPYTVRGPVVFKCSRILLDNFLPAIQGGSESANVFDFAETLPEFQLMIDRGAKVFTYTGCKVNRATFFGRKQGFLFLKLDIEALTEVVGNSGSFPSLTMPTEKPFIFSDGALTLQSGARKFQQVQIVVDNDLLTDKFENGLTRAELPTQDRKCFIGSDHPWTSSETDLYGQALAGAAGTLVCTNANESGTILTFTMAAIQYPDHSPTVKDKGETRLNLRGEIRKSSTTNDLVITNAHS